MVGSAEVFSDGFPVRPERPSMRRLLSLLASSALFTAFALPARTVAAEDAAPPSGEPTEGKKDDREKKDDTNISNDYKIAMRRGIKWRKDRAAFWADKGVEDKLQ